jgi:hypothetical protein
MIAGILQDIVGTSALERVATFPIPETSGKDTLAEAGDVFKGGVLMGEAKSGPSKPTKKTYAGAYVRNEKGSVASSYRVLFSFFGWNLQRLCWTESQIVAYCRLYPQYLLGGASFVFEDGDKKFFVAGVMVNREGLLAMRAAPFYFGSVWENDTIDDSYAHNLIIPLP